MLWFVANHKNVIPLQGKGRIRFTACHFFVVAQSSLEVAVAKVIEIWEYKPVEAGKIRCFDYLS